MYSFLLVVTCFFVALNGIYCAIFLGLLSRRRPVPRALAYVVVAWAVLMFGLFLFQVFFPVDWRPAWRRWYYLPVSVEMSWNLLLLMPTVIGGALLWLALRLLRPARTSEPASLPADLSRRKFLYLLACGAAPATALGMGVHGSNIRYDLRVRRYDLPLAHLPPALDGFTIAHVSDLHSGIFCGPRRLRLIADATNDLKPDLIALTGDFINSAMSEFPDALLALQRMRAPRGLYLCEGNHDTIPGAGLVARAFTLQGFPFLSNRTLSVPVEDSRLVIAGLPWMRPEHVAPDVVTRLFSERKKGDVRLLLAHHPDLFDHARSCDLMLSGHTHGGQIMLDDVGLGPLFFKHWSGRYPSGDRTLIVSNGCGDWFPCRIGAPAEIGLLTLRRAA